MKELVTESVKSLVSWYSGCSRRCRRWRGDIIEKQYKSNGIERHYIALGVLDGLEYVGRRCLNVSLVVAVETHNGISWVYETLRDHYCIKKKISI